MRSSPQEGFSSASLRISLRASTGSRGLPGLDFHLQSSLNPRRCQRTRVAGLTTTSALRQSKSLDAKAMTSRDPRLGRLGLTSRSWYSASCLRRKVISAARATTSPTPGHPTRRTSRSAAATMATASAAVATVGSGMAATVPAGGGGKRWHRGLDAR